MKYAVIGGANSGLASASIKELVNNGFVVFAGDKSIKEIYIEGNIHYLPLDITNNDSLQNMFNYVSSITDHVDIVSSFAGIVTLGSFVEKDLDAMSKIIDVNLIGTYKLNNIFFTLIEKCKGRFINISSEYGLIDAMPFHGFYPLSKHALEVYNDSLRRELSSLGIKVVIIRPGAFKTSMQGGIIDQFENLVTETTHFKKTLLKMKSLMVGELKKAKDPKKFARVYLKACLKKRPRKRYNVCNSFLMKLYNICPSFIQDWFFKKVF